MVAKGRPPLDDSERAKPRTIRLTDADYAELRRRGLCSLREWLRGVDDAAEMREDLSHARAGWESAAAALHEADDRIAELEQEREAYYGRAY